VDPLRIGDIKSITPDTADVRVTTTLLLGNLGKEVSESHEVKKEKVAKREWMCYIGHIM